MAQERCFSLPPPKIARRWRNCFLKPPNPPLETWHGRTVWIVGASSGIGLALAEALHQQGAFVVVSARNALALQAFAQAAPYRLALPVDVSDAAAVTAAARQLSRTGHWPDLVCFCAARYKAMRADTMSLDECILHQRINVEGALAVAAAVLPEMLRRGHGHLSLVASVAGFHGLPLALAYGPTKAALINLAETLHLDLKPRNLGVSLITPGFVDTPLTRSNRFRMPALITPQEAAQAVLAGWQRGDFFIHFPRRFTVWMRLLRVLPYRISFGLVRRITQP